MNLFSILIGLGASLGLLRLLQVSPRETRLRWQAAGLITLTGSLVGARVGFLIAYHEYFATHPQEMLRVDLGGLSLPGALAGALLFAWLGIKLLGFSTADGFDRLGRMLLPVAAAAWLGAWLAPVAYGRPLPAGTWWGLPMPDDAGLVTLRLPLQPLALLSLLLLLPLTETFTRKVKKKGVKEAAAFFVFSIHCTFFSFLRYDSVQTFFGIRLDTWAALANLLLALMLLIVAVARPNPHNAVKMEAVHETQPGNGTDQHGPRRREQEPRKTPRPDRRSARQGRGPDPLP